MARRLAFAVLMVSALGAWAPALDAQYFGRNKVQYRTFDFQVLPSAHFDLYYYPEEREAAEIASRMAERWYTRLSRFFGHELRGRQAIILYAVSAHFRQTNAIEGLIGEGTGGVTEALKRRIVLPMSGSLADTDHVLGHEMVHAFQFDLTGADPREASGTVPGILAYPLWFAEGMAEYLSLGPVDAQTAMWLRDAALRERLPDIKDLEDPRYFPYRWGHAFWAYIGATYGDRAVASLVRSGANPRDDIGGLARQLGTDPETLTNDWHQAILKSARAVALDLPALRSDARPLISEKTGGGRFNIGPRVSPDGTEIAFFSSRDIFSVDLYLANVETGHIEKRLIKTATDPHFDSLEFLTSAGAWSPDGKTIALAATKSGRPVLALIDVRQARIAREIDLPGLDDALDPAFSPDGRTVVLSGNAGGLIDLYQLTMETGQLARLTHDPFADLEPTFTPDGQSIVFVTERYTTDIATLKPGALRLARIDGTTHVVTPIPGFLKGKHLSPQVSADGKTVTFIAEPDGVSNLYRMSIDGGPISQVSAFSTGVAGITTSSPALSSSRDGTLVFSVFEDDGHSIYALDEPRIVSMVPPPVSAVGAYLPGRTATPGDVERALTDPMRGLPPPSAAAPESTEYKGGLSLDMLGQPQISGGYTSYGGFVSGGMSAFFSDMLGDRQLGVSASVSGSLLDIGGQAVYINRRHRWNWGASADITPLRYGYLARTDLQDGTVQVQEVVERQTRRGGTVAAIYPFNPTTRFEAMAGGRNLSFTRDITTLIYDRATTNLLDRSVESSTFAKPMYLVEGTIALVRDSSFFGATAPLYGGRSRIEVTASGGSLQYAGLLLDWRRYYMPKKPFTLAVRAMHYGRYGHDAEHPQLLNLYAGYPELVHGYGYGSFTPLDCQVVRDEQRCSVFDDLIGSRLLVANVEVRAPLMGLFNGQLQYGRVPVDVAAFFDAGVTWSSSTLPSFAGGTRSPMRSAGGAVRANIFGFLVVEFAASHAFDRTGAVQWQFGVRQGF